MVILKSILILSIIATFVNSIIIFANFVSILNQKEMIFTTRYKYTDLLITNNTKEIIKGNGEIKQLEEVPQVGVRFGGSTINKVYKLNNGVYVYAAFQGIQIDQIQQYMARIIVNSANQIFMMSNKYNEAIIPNNYKDKICFYDDTKRGKQQIKQILEKCLQHYHQKQPQNYSKQQIINQPPYYFIPLLSLIICAAFTGSKLFILHHKSSQHSGV